MAAREYFVGGPVHVQDMEIVANYLVGVQMAPGVNGGEPEVPMGLMFVDNDDHETHVYLFSESGRKALVAALTGGVALP